MAQAGAKEKSAGEWNSCTTTTPAAAAAAAAAITTTTTTTSAITTYYYCYCHNSVIIIIIIVLLITIRSALFIEVLNPINREMIDGMKEAGQDTDAYCEDIFSSTQLLS